MAVDEWTGDLVQWLNGLALEAGFDLSGIAALGTGVEALGSERFGTWIEAGYAGEMDYLKRRNESGQFLRSEVRAAIPWAQSVIVCALNYNAGGPLSIDPSESSQGWIGRYAWSGRTSSGQQRGEAAAGHGLLATDYHEELLEKLRGIEAALVDRLPCETRCYVDTGPLVERTVAARAGIGWTGKNTCTLNQELGSWLLLGVIVTSLPMSAGLSVAEAADRCGSCTRCIDACPTGALVDERQMDASRCIAYLTIEHKGMIAEDLRGAVGRQVFGCDICQDVCPWNRRSPVAVREGSLAREELINPALDWLANLNPGEFKRLFKGSPVERTGRKRLLRNVAIAMGNSGEVQFGPQLSEWLDGEDEILAKTSAWALERIPEVSGNGK